MRIDNPSISGSLSFIGGTNSISATSVSLTGSLSGTFEGAFSSTATANISGAFDSVSQSLASDISLNRSSINSLNSASSSYLLNTTDTLDGDLTVTGTITAQEFHTEFVSASIIYQSGSTKFGDTSDDNHDFTGSVSIASGSLQVWQTTSSKYLNIFGGNSGNFIDSYGADLYLRADGNSNNSLIIFNSGNVRAHRNFYVDENVGIGTTSPGVKLTVLENVANFASTITNSNSSGQGVQITGGNGTSNVLQLRNYLGGEVMRVQGNSTIGIGTTDPQTNLLSIRGFGAIDSNANQGLVLSSNHYYDSGDKYIGNGYASIISQDTGGSYAGFIRFQQAGLNSSGAGAAMTLSNSMVIDESGNVGIGTTSPDTALTIESTTSPEIKISNGGGISPSPTLTFFRQSGVSAFVRYDVANKNIIIQNSYSTADSAGNIYFNTRGGTARMAITGAGNVGIGTTSPSSLLHIVGSTPTVKVEGTSTDSAKIDLVGTFTTWSLENQYVNGQTNDMFRLYNSALGADAITVNRSTNNVGIGSTSPSYKLDVNGSARVGNFLTFSTGTSIPSAAISYHTNGYLYIKGGGSGAAIGDDNFATSVYCIDNGNIEFNTAGTGTKMVINSSGNVGIGTTSPGARLDVDGNIIAGGGNSIISGTGLFTTSTIQLHNGDAAANNINRMADIVLANNTSYTDGILGRIIAVNSSLSSDEKRNAQISFNNDGATNSGSIGFSTSNAGTYSSKMVIKADGNVGIGTTTPSNLLHLLGNSAAIRIEESGGAQVRMAAGGSTGYLGTYTNHELQFLINGNNAITVDTSRNVGIGTTSPNSKLTIQSGGDATLFSIRGHLSAYSYPNIFEVVQTSADAFVNIKTGAGNTITSLSGYSGTPSYFLSNVGIGDTSPNAKLHITGKASYTTANSSEVAGLGFIRLQPNSNSEHALWVHNAGNNLGLSGYADAATSSTRDITLQAFGGNVGIGTSSPSYPIDVVSADSSAAGLNIRGRSTDNIGELNFRSYDNSSIYGRVDGRSSGHGLGLWSWSRDMMFYQDGSVKMTLKSNGNVGIGTTSPIADLHINDTDGAVIVYQGDKRGKMIGKTIQRGTVSNPKTDLFTINSFQSANSNLYAVVTVLYVSPTSTNGGKMSAQFWIDNDNQSSPTIGSFTHEQQVGSATFSLEWDNTNKILKFVPASANYWYYVVDVEYVAFDGASVTFNTGHSSSET